MKLYKRLGIALIGGICAVSVSTTWAVYTDTNTIKNQLSTKHTAVMLKEDFVQFSSFLPGETVTKKPYFENTGARDMLIRVPIELAETWQEPEEGSEEQLDKEKVIKNWSQYWVNGKSSEWFAGEDYYYYNKILTKQGTENSKTNQIMDSLTLSTDVSNDGHEADYSNAEYEITIEAEAVPADKTSAALWAEDLRNVDFDATGCEWSGLLNTTE